MIRLWLTVPALLLLAAVGRGLDAALRLQLASAGAARWPLCVLAALAAGYVALVAPLALPAAVGIAWLRRRIPPEDPVAPPRWIWAVLVLLTALSAVRPAATPLYWDEFVWLAKAKLAATGLSALRDATLSPEIEVVPSGYPVLYPTVSAWLSAGRSVLAGAAALELLTVAAFVGLVAATRRPPLTLLFVFGTPLVIVHLRGTYADLPIGLLATAMLLCLVAERPRAPAAATLAVVLVGLKDEGFAHVAAVAAAVGLVAALRRDRSRLDGCAAALACGALPFVAWRVLLARHGVTDADHALGWPDLSQLDELAVALAAHVADLPSWGILWPLAAAALALSATRRRDPARSSVALALAAQSLVLAIGVACGPGRVREFAFGGTLINRLLIQLAPTAGLLVALMAPTRSAAAARAPLR